MSTSRMKKTKNKTEGLTDVPLAGIIQKAREDLPTIIDRVAKSIQRKFPPGPLRGHYARMLVWDG